MKEVGGFIRKRVKLILIVFKKDFINVLRGMDVNINEKSLIGKSLKVN